MGHPEVISPEDDDLVCYSSVETYWIVACLGDWTRKAVETGFVRSCGSQTKSFDLYRAKRKLSDWKVDVALTMLMYTDILLRGCSLIGDMFGSWPRSRVAEAAEEMGSKPDGSVLERCYRDDGQGIAGRDHVDKRHTAELEVVHMRRFLLAAGVEEAERNNWTEHWCPCSHSYSYCRQKAGGRDWDHRRRQARMVDKDWMKDEQTEG